MKKKKKKNQTNIILKFNENSIRDGKIKIILFHKKRICETTFYL